MHSLPWAPGTMPLNGCLWLQIPGSALRALLPLHQKEHLRPKHGSRDPVRTDTRHHHHLWLISLLGNCLWILCDLDRLLNFEQDTGSLQKRLVENTGVPASSEPSFGHKDANLSFFLCEKTHASSAVAILLSTTTSDFQMGKMLAFFAQAFPVFLSALQ